MSGHAAGSGARGRTGSGLALWKGIWVESGGCRASEVRNMNSSRQDSSFHSSRALTPDAVGTEGAGLDTDLPFGPSLRRFIRKCTSKRRTHEHTPPFFLRSTFLLWSSAGTLGPCGLTSASPRTRPAQQPAQNTPFSTAAGTARLHLRFIPRLQGPTGRSFVRQSATRSMTHSPSPPTALGINSPLHHAALSRRCPTAELYGPRRSRPAPPLGFRRRDYARSISVGRCGRMAARWQNPDLATRPVAVPRPRRHRCSATSAGYRVFSASSNAQSALIP
ncbi:hypothetical protein PHLGIDRAFT_175302 [Phlebiopsis gigantea 11061_1 CR5-6]|uniref:Uncharacterized protein n=1 Tax=Phlebiopsis gigantea (strain 11061_1 CR5-6) TaxID=745531 RepID=A0A0C3RUY3_PHLG1|nr:hypothetical protein PHLGIDRAFT_175302 [Phlebiopsis gigantea 11061_1 CR5-6]